MTEQSTKENVPVIKEEPISEEQLTQSDSTDITIIDYINTDSSNPAANTKRTTSTTRSINTDDENIYYITDSSSTPSPPLPPSPPPPPPPPSPSLSLSSTSTQQYTTREIEEIRYHYYRNDRVKFRVKWKSYDIETTEDANDLIFAYSKNVLKEYIKNKSKRVKTTICKKAPILAQLLKQ